MGALIERSFHKFPPDPLRPELDEDDKTWEAWKEAVGYYERWKNSQAHDELRFEMSSVTLHHVYQATRSDAALRLWAVDALASDPELLLLDGCKYRQIIADAPKGYVGDLFKRVFALKAELGRDGTELKHVFREPEKCIYHVHDSDRCAGR